MRKIIVLIFMVMALCACTNSVEGDAKKQMEITMKELAKDPSSVIISDVKNILNFENLKFFKTKTFLAYYYQLFF